MISRVRSTPGGVDQYGDPVAGTETVTAIPGAFVGPRTSESIDQAGRSGAVIGLTLFMPYAFDLQRTDLVDVDGVRYRIVGERGDWENPFTSWEAGSTAALERAEG